MRLNPNGFSGTAMLRHLALPLIIGGIVTHLWLSSMAGLAIAMLGSAAHLGIAALGGRWILRHRRAD